MHFQAPEKLPSQRLTLLRYGIVIVVLLLLAGFWRLQVVRSDYYARLAEMNRIRTLPVMAPRGLIYDRHGRVLVDHVVSFSVILLREHLDDIQDKLPAISRGLDLDRRWLEERLEEHADDPLYQPIVLKDEATMADIAFIEAHRTDLPELELLLMYRRRYPPDRFAAHLFGHLGETSSEQVETGRYELGSLVGKMGVEKRLNGLLMGQSGQRRVIVDSRGKEVEKLDFIRPVPGRPIQLTLDYRLQRAAEEAMEDRQGALVALDPRTGDILAWVSRPAFNPQSFAIRIQPEEWNDLTTHPEKPLLNRPIQAQLAPGSVFKVIVATAALEEGIVDEDFTVRCPGWARHYGQTFRCWVPEGHGRVDLHKALVESCDVFYYRVGRELGIDRITDYAKKFGLGEPTGVNLPGEEAGLVPSRDWKRRVRKEPWYDGETISVAIGQGPIMVTPLQLAHALGGIASGGLFAEPRLVLQPGRDPVYTRVALQPETVQRVTDALWGVVNEDDGTGRGARLPDIDVAGKTGTAQLVALDTLEKLGEEADRKLIDNAWFVGLSPRRNPEIVVTVLLEHGEHGAAAAPLARQVIKAYYESKLPRPEMKLAEAAGLAEGED